LVEYIGAADIYITPYLGREQITSGALAYTVGAGKAVISTPYPYATELLAQGRGLLVPFGNSAAITEQVGHLLDEPDARRVLGEHAYRFGRQMIWPTVAQRYLDCFAAVLAENEQLRPAVLSAASGQAIAAWSEAAFS
jgi:glycosyltransferase involved in cell wall biosynthesis